MNCDFSKLIKVNMFAAVVAIAGITWYLDKTAGNSKQFTNKQGESITVKDPFRPVELGYGRELGSKIPWGSDRTTHIGDMDFKQPNPYINILPGGENTNVTDMKQAVLPNQLSNFRKIVNQRENLEEYWRFDNYLGGKYPMANSGVHRNSSIAYMYDDSEL